MGSTVGISVIVPTHSGRETLTRRLIDSYLDAIQHSELPCELIIVDSSIGPSSKGLASFCESQGIHYQRGPRGAGVKRNLGAVAAQYDALLFIDSDCALTASTLQQHGRIFEHSEQVGAVTGATDLDGPITSLWQVLEWSGMYSRCYDHARLYEQVLWGVTANICVRRSAFDKIGGFDEGIVTPVGGEDVDFGVRLTDAGYIIRTNPGALVKHAREHVTTRHVAKSLLTYGRADSYLCQQHPHRSETYLDPVVVGLIGLGAGAVLRRRPRTVLAWTLAGWALAAIKRQTEMPYTPGESQRVTSPADSVRRVAAGALDSCFDLGRLVQGLRSGRLDLLAKRFRYVDDSFVSRKQGAVGGGPNGE